MANRPLSRSISLAGLAIAGLILLYYDPAPAITTSITSALLASPDGTVRSRADRFAFSPDGNTLASIADEGQIALLDLVSGRERAFPADFSDGVATDLAFSPDGTTLASALPGTVTLWDVESGSERAILGGPFGSTVSDLMFSPNGEFLAVVADGTHILIWDVASGSQRSVLSSGDPVLGIAFAPDSRILASSGENERIKLWDVPLGQELETLTSRAAVTGLAFSPVGMTLASADREANLSLWDLELGDDKQILTGHNGPIERLTFDPDGTLLASGGIDAKVKLWDVTSGQEHSSLSGAGAAAIHGLAFSPDGKILASAGENNQIRLWEVKSGKLRGSLVGHNDIISEIAFSQSHQVLASVANDGMVIVWDLTRGMKERLTHQISGFGSATDLGVQSLNTANDSSTATAVSENPVDPPPSESRASEAISPAAEAPPSPRKKARPRNWRGITALAISPDGTRVGTGGADSAIRIWDPAGAELSAVQGHHGAGVTGVTFSADGKHLLSVGRDTELSELDAASSSETRIFLAHEHPIRTIAASPDGKSLASAGEETRVMLWDAVTGKLTNILSGHRDFVNSLAFSPDGKHLASGDADARILLWDVTTGKLVRTLLGHSGEVNAVAFSRDGSLLFSASEDTQVKVWNAATGQEIRSLTGHQAPVRAVAVSPDGQTLVSSGEDARILVWATASGGLRRILPRNTRFINALVFHPSGRLFVADEDEQLTEWDVVTATKVRTRRPSRSPQANNSSAVTAVAATTTLGSSRPPTDPTAAGAANLAVRNIFGRLLDWLIPPAAAQIPNPPGGPILVITSPSSTFSNYYAEIVRNEGLNAFAVAAIANVTAGTLASHEVVILAPTSLSASQVTMFTDWVNAGGNLIAMRPDPQLAGLLGISFAGSTLSNAYLLVDTSKAPGNGIVGQTIQFHGTADRYTLNGASSLATLYTNASTATSNPALTLRSVGANGGQAAAFSYDLATSIVNTRQGNPAWATQERDGFTPIRSDDKFFGNATGDPQPDWVDLNKVAIPQGDEQQRLLANLILETNRDRKPLPRFWYFPRGEKAVVIMTGDDHGNGGTAGRFDQFIAQSPPGCSVADWECVRGTSYIYTQTPLTNAQAAQYNTAGFEIGLHINTNCADFTPASLETFYTQQIADWTAKYTSIPAPITQRHHCIAWSDWVTAATVQLTHGIRLDTTYYFWPPGWVLNRPGFFTGSGMPMRFSALDGTLIDVYHAASQMTDESGQQYPFTVNTLLDRALGAEGYYGAFTINAHTDVAQIPESDAAVSSALARGVPIVSSRQMMNWLDGRNNSSFGSLAWSGNALSFTVTPGTGAIGLQALVPLVSNAGMLTTLQRGGSSVSFTTDVIKGVGYAFFAATAGSYVATYAADTNPPTVISTSPANGATGVNQGTNVTATFSEPMSAATVSSNFELRSASTIVSATVTYNATTRTATLTPSATLAASTTYTATVKGGATGVKDLAGNAMTADFVWSFTTEAAPCSSSCTGFGGTTPTNPSASDPNAVELGVKFRSNVDGFITGIRFYKGTGNTGTHVGRLWTAAGQQLATATFSGETATGWQQVSFGTPVAITANTVYVASYHAPNGGYAFDSNFFATSGFQNGPLYFLRDGENGGNGVYVYGAGGFPTNTFNATNYWVDVVFTTSGGSPPDTTPPTVTSTTPANGATGVNPGTTVTATFSEAMNATTVSTSTFELRDSASALVPATVTYSANTATLTPSSALVNGVTYTATVKGGATDPRVKDVAGNALAASQTWSFTIAAAADTTPPTVTSTTPANGATGVNTGTTVTATFSEAMDPATVNTSTFELRDGASTLVPATVTYSANTATLTPSSALANGVTHTATVKGGATDPRVKDVAGNALVANATWSFTTATLSTCTGNSIWAPTAVPGTPAESDTAAVELGLKFRSDVNGTVCGVRFYKSSQNTGTHVGKLWSSSGTLLAQATFTGETASGWQQVNFASPVAVTANTVYVVSYHAPNGRYSVDEGYFTAAGVDNPPLHALQNGVSGGNGVFLYGAGGFPTNTFNATNYWVDVVFTSSAAPTPPGPPTGLAATASAAGVALTWSANPEGDLAGYHVYRATSSTGPFTQLNATLLSASPNPSYEDTLAPNGTSHYRVTAVDTVGDESIPSATASAGMTLANRLLNPGFELDANNDSRPDSWSSNANFTRSNVLARSGVFSGRHFSSANAGYTITQVVTGLTGSTNYTFAGWVNIPSNTDPFTLTLRVRWRNALNIVLRTDNIKTYSASTSGWDKATASSSLTPTGTTNAQVQMVVSSLNRTIYVDDFAVR
ncbi:MAG: DUF4082 domain-containing protein [Gammaproteobacteria bacterium]